MNQDSGDVARVRGLIEAKVPEVASGLVEIRGLARKPGSRCILVVNAHDESLDAVGAVVGNRGSRIKPIVAELGGERMHVVRWADSVEQFLGNLFAPNKVLRVRYDDSNRRASISLAAADVTDSSMTMRLRLASDLIGWNLTLE